MSGEFTDLLKDTRYQYFPKPTREEKPMNDEIVLAKPVEMMRLATDVAGVCREIVQKTAVNIKGRHYVRVEGWQSIATAHGCVAGSRDVERIDGGIRAIGEIRRQDNGALIATAEGFVGDDEKTWSNRDEYAKRAMAQTRAISRACRSAFAHVVVLIDTNLSTTPYEEVPQNGFTENHSIEQRQERREREAVNAGNAPIKTIEDVRRVMNEPPPFQGDWRNTVCMYGKKDGPLRGEQLGELGSKQLHFLTSMFLKRDRTEIDAKDLPMRDALEAYQRELEATVERAREPVAVDSAGDPLNDPDDQIPF